jgi:uncharacterized protein
MDLTHRFTVPAPLDEAWTTFNDLARVAPCFPGAVLTSYDGRDFAGLVKVKLGPISLQYTGSGTFVERDDVTHRAVIEAKGKDKRGNGTAAARVTTRLVGRDDDSTDVEVLTVLNITGRPAQFGRGMMQEVGDKLLGQFAACLETKLGAETAGPAGGDEPEPVGDENAPPESVLADSVPADSTLNGSGVHGALAATTVAKKGPAKKAPAKKASAEKTPAKETTPKKTPAEKAPAKKASAKKAAVNQTAATTASEQEVAPTRDTDRVASNGSASPQSPSEAAGEQRLTTAFHEPAVLDLGRTVLPIVARRLAPAALAIVGLVVIWRLVRRLR